MWPTAEIRTFDEPCRQRRSVLVLCIDVTKHRCRCRSTHARTSPGLYTSCGARTPGTMPCLHEEQVQDVWFGGVWLNRSLNEGLTLPVRGCSVS